MNCITFVYIQNKIQMKSKLLLAILLLGGLSTSQAQTTTVYSNDFTVATGLTTFDADGDTKTWGLYPGNATTNTWGLTGNFVGSQSWDGTLGPLTPDNYLLTPLIVIPTTFGSTNLSFVCGATDTTFFAEQISVYLAPASATTPAMIAALTPVFNLVLTSGYARTGIVQNIDVSSYAGQSVKIVMRHHDCTDQNLLYFDTLSLTQTVLGVEQFAASQFSISPNPASSIINIDGKLDAKINAVTVTDLNGRTVKQNTFDNLSKVQINIADLSSGIYMMNIATKGGIATKKIIKN
jgi:hypothetical protein